MALFCCVINVLVFSSSLIIFTSETLKVLQTADTEQRRLGSSYTPSKSPGTSSTGSTSSRNSSLSTQSSRRSLTMANTTPRTTAASTRAAQNAEQFQQGIDAIQAAKNGEKKVEITVGKLNDLKKLAAASNKLAKDLAAEQKKSEHLESCCKDYEEKAASDAVANQVLTDTITKKTR